MTTQYKTLFNKLNMEDEKILSNKKKEKVQEFYKQIELSGDVEKLDRDMINDLHFFNSYITKPAPPNVCVALRKTISAHLDIASPEQTVTLISYVKHFECL